MSALPVDRAAAAPALRLVPAMSDALPAPLPFPPARRFKNTVRCQGPLGCGIPLVGITKDRQFIPLLPQSPDPDFARAFPPLDHDRHWMIQVRDGKPFMDVRCPACGTVRSIEMR